MLPGKENLYLLSRSGRKNHMDKQMEDLICYCFNYTVSDIENDVQRNGKSTIMERILSEKKAGGCRCAEKNPKGR